MLFLILYIYIYYVYIFVVKVKQTKKILYIYWVLVESAPFPSGRVHVVVERGIATFAVFYVSGDLLTEEAVKVVAAGLTVCGGVIGRLCVMLVVVVAVVVVV